LFSREDIQLFYQIALKGVQDLHLAPTPAIGFEMTLLRMVAFRPAPVTSIPPLLHQTRSLPHPSSPTPLPPETHGEVLAPQDTHQTDALDWGNLILQLNLNGLALSAANHTEWVSQSDTGIVLRIAKGHQSLLTKAVISRIEQSLTTYHKKMMKLTIIADEVLSSPNQELQKSKKLMMDTAKESLQGDLFFQQLQEEFSAELVKNSIAPLKDDL
ncbi:MAG: DNA polymerase III, subunit gamma and tau, partial [Legionellales bacterium]|nr:DNA polymerase III, subunit gamma and tau [Legionellales bacterium]